jgi:hypothetical protein
MNHTFILLSCAWVLWQQPLPMRCTPLPDTRIRCEGDPAPTPHAAWGIVTLYETAAACEEAITTRLAHDHAAGNVAGTFAAADVPASTLGLWDMRYQCLPKDRDPTGGR